MSENFDKFYLFSKKCLQTFGIDLLCDKCKTNYRGRMKGKLTCHLAKCEENFCFKYGSLKPHTVRKLNGECICDCDVMHTGNSCSVCKPDYYDSDCIGLKIRQIRIILFMCKL